MKFRFRQSVPFGLLLLFFIGMTASVWAEESVLMDSATLIRREILIDEMLKLDPVTDQIDRAVTYYITKTMADTPQKDRDIFRMALMKFIDAQALEKTARDSYAELFTESELQVMVDYYKRPESRSIKEKLPLFQGRVQPAIVKMLDQGLMRLKTETQE